MNEGRSEVTVRDMLAWLGIPWAVYEESARILAGRHGNPIESALLDARAAQGTATTADEVLVRHGIDRDDPLVAVRAFDGARARFDS